VKLVHQFGFITKKFFTMHGHVNVKLYEYAFKNAVDLDSPALPLM